MLEDGSTRALSLARAAVPRESLEFAPRAVDIFCG